MTVHELEIYNRALSNIGVQQIPSTDHVSERTKACEANYKRALEYVLGIYNWNCSAKRAVLTPLEKAPLFEWQFQYELPNDCIRLENIIGLKTGDFVIEGRNILTDASTLQIVYSAYIEDITKISPHVVELLGYKLAGLIAPILKTVDDGMMALQMLAASIETAVAIDSGQVTVPEETTDEWLEAFT